MAFYKDKEIPEELVKEALSVLQQVRSARGKIRKGTNEVTKSVERGNSKLVYIAEDVDPPEIVAHIPYLCKEKNIQYVYIPRKEQMTDAMDLDINSASVSIDNPLDAEADLEKLLEKLNAL